MAIDHFIPEVWAARVLEFLNKSLVAGNIVTREYQSDIVRGGDTVHISSFANPTIGDYTKNGTTGDPETLVSSQQSLLIDQQKFFNFEIDNIDTAQQVPKIMDDAMSQAGYGLSDAMDTFILGLHTGVAAANIVGLGNDTTPVVPVSTDIYKYFTQAGMLLDEANVPSEGRWVVIPPWMKKMLLDSGELLRDTAYGDAVLQTGMFGSIAGFNVYVSNNVDNTAGAKYKVMFGYPRAIALAEQINKVAAFEPEGSFSDAIKGLHVYGGKLIQSTGIAVMTANKA